jgi:lysyl-tRNA synthetase class 2
MKLFEAARGMGIDVDKTMGKGKLMKSLALNAKEIIFNQLITDYPKEMSPLHNRDNPRIQNVLN